MRMLKPTPILISDTNWRMQSQHMKSLTLKLLNQSVMMPNYTDTCAKSLH